MVLTALMMALVCVATMVIAIPTPMTGGFVNLGDCFVLLSAWVLGPVYGMAAGGIGSALADILLSYTHYAPGTLIIKGLMALVAALVFRAAKGAIKKDYPARLLSAIPAELIMIAGYFGYAWLILGKSAAAALTSVPDNAFQAVVGTVAAIALCGVVDVTRLAGKKARKAGNH